MCRIISNQTWKLLFQVSYQSGSNLTRNLFANLKSILNLTHFSSNPKKKIIHILIFTYMPPSPNFETILHFSKYQCLLIIKQTITKFCLSVAEKIANFNNWLQGKLQMLSIGYGKYLWISSFGCRRKFDIGNFVSWLQKGIMNFITWGEKKKKFMNSVKISLKQNRQFCQSLVSKVVNNQSIAEKKCKFYHTFFAVGHRKENCKFS